MGVGACGRKKGRHAISRTHAHAHAHTRTHTHSLSQSLSLSFAVCACRNACMFGCVWMWVCRREKSMHFLSPSPSHTMPLSQLAWSCASPTRCVDGAMKRFEPAASPTSGSCASDYITPCKHTSAKCPTASSSWRHAMRQSRCGAASACFYLHSLLPPPPVLPSCSPFTYKHARMRTLFCVSW